MSKFAPVAPVHVVEKLSPKACGDYHLLLAHDVAANNEAYNRFFRTIHEPTIIMDNSVIELGGAVDLSVIGKACSAVPSTSIVLPDVLLDTKATVESCKAAIETWAPYFLTMGMKGFMFVPQGKTLQDFAWCAQQFADDERINFWGVPRNLVAQIGSRKEAIDIVSAINPHRRVHLLGFSDDVCDDVICARDRRVEGIDSAVPLRAGSLGIEFSFNTDMPKRGSWWDEAVHVPLMDQNIETYQNWIRRSHK